MFRCLVCCAIVLAVGCATESTDSADEDKANATAIPVRPIDPALSDQESLVLANSDFAFDLYARLHYARDNLAFSPYIVSIALELCCAGSRGRTETEIAKCLRLPFAQERAHSAWHDLNQALRSTLEAQGVTLELANRLWVDESLQIEESYVDLTREQYEAEAAKVAFAARPADACRDINDWIRSKTHGKIGRVVSAKDLVDARLLLTCCVYFKATWAQPFFEPATTPGTFYIDAGHTIEAPMMHCDDVGDSFRLSETHDLQLLELRYHIPPNGGGDFCMLVLLPKRRDGLPELEGKLTTDNLNHWVAGLKQGHIEIYLPRFSVRSQLELAEPLSEMGMGSAFRRDQANFAGISGAERLYLMRAIHAAMIDVDEKGTEAAATQRFLLGAFDDSKPLVFRADHPFLFLIRHNPTGTILFMGRVVNPVGA